jgi:hypothetical protein
MINVDADALSGELSLNLSAKSHSTNGTRRTEAVTMRSLAASGAPSAFSFERYIESIVACRRLVVLADVI